MLFKEAPLCDSIEELSKFWEGICIQIRRGYEKSWWDFREKSSRSIG